MWLSLLGSERRADERPYPPPIAPDGTQRQVQHHRMAAQVPHPDSAPVRDGEAAGGPGGGREDGEMRAVEERWRAASAAAGGRWRQLGSPAALNPLTSHSPAVLVEGEVELASCTSVCAQ